MATVPPGVLAALPLPRARGGRRRPPSAGGRPRGLFPALPAHLRVLLHHGGAGGLPRVPDVQLVPQMRRGGPGEAQALVRELHHPPARGAASARGGSALWDPRPGLCARAPRNLTSSPRAGLGRLLQAPQGPCACGTGLGLGNRRAHHTPHDPLGAGEARLWCERDGVPQYTRPRGGDPQGDAGGQQVRGATPPPPAGQARGHRPRRPVPP
mmetsp:Transcript_17217/g.55134  ORF Transcript_17217/g.55134 Transcript_17217/m.55134 type:complete len:211 (+) Transcript_17217:337-969(+)